MAYTYGNNNMLAHLIWWRSWGGTFGLAVNRNYNKIARELRYRFPRQIEQTPHSLKFVRQIIMNTHRPYNHRNRSLAILNRLTPYIINANKPRANNRRSQNNTRRNQNLANLIYLKGREGVWTTNTTGIRRGTLNTRAIVKNMLEKSPNRVKGRHNANAVRRMIYQKWVTGVAPPGEKERMNVILGMLKPYFNK